jgi:hypothetical protein
MVDFFSPLPEKAADFTKARMLCCAPAFSAHVFAYTLRASILPSTESRDKRAVPLALWEQTDDRCLQGSLNSTAAFFPKPLEFFIFLS